jgi:hypothetical protein
VCIRFSHRGSELEKIAMVLRAALPGAAEIEP